VKSYSIFMKLIVFLVMSFQSNISMAWEKLVFTELYINTGFRGDVLYNNGRMQKPIEISYSAYKYGDPYKLPVLLTDDQKYFYLKLAKFGETPNAPVSIEIGNPKFSIGLTESPIFEQNLGTYNKMTKGSKANSAILYLQYKGSSATDIHDNLNLCVFPNGEELNENNYPTSGYPGQNCSTNSPGSNYRQLKIISGAYPVSYVENGDGNAIALVTPIGQSLCSSCDQYLTQIGGSDVLVDVTANKYIFKSSRQGHNINYKIGQAKKLLAVGCKSFSSDIDETCNDTGSIDWYKTEFHLGNNHIISRYSTRNGAVLESPRAYTFPFQDVNRTGSFSVVAVTQDVYYTRNKPKLFVIKDDGYNSLQNMHPTEASNVDINETMIDNFGNIIKFSGKILGWIPSEGNRYQLNELALNTVKIDSDYTTPVCKIWVSNYTVQSNSKVGELYSYLDGSNVYIYKLLTTGHNYTTFPPATPGSVNSAWEYMGSWQDGYSGCI
jgi:hypothetical protein